MSSDYQDSDKSKNIDFLFGDVPFDLFQDAHHGRVLLDDAKKEEIIEIPIAKSDGNAPDKGRSDDKVQSGDSSKGSPSNHLHNDPRSNLEDHHSDHVIPEKMNPDVDPIILHHDKSQEISNHDHGDHDHGHHLRANFIKSQHHTNEHVHADGGSILLVLFTVLCCQSLIWWWKRRYHRSFFLFTLGGLWLFPVLWSLYLLYWRMIVIWSLFSFCFIVLLKMSRRKPMNRKTPRFLYSWFFMLYKVTNGLAVIGYCLFLADFFGFGYLVFGPHPKEEREYRSKLMHHQHEAHLHAMKGDADDAAVKMEMDGEVEELKALSHSYHHIHFADIGIYLLFYGLYYGVLARDTAKLCTESISSALGFFNPSGFPRRRVPTNICAVCNNPLINHDIGLFDRDDDDEDVEASAPSKERGIDRRTRIMNQRRRMEQKTAAALQGGDRGILGWILNTFCWRCSPQNTKQDEEVVLNCGHRFHGFCIRGWIMIGKRDVCPVCKEKVSLKGVFANPWQKQDRMWSQLLDGVRYLLVWNPIIVLSANIVFSQFGMPFGKKHHH